MAAGVTATRLQRLSRMPEGGMTSALCSDVTTTPEDADILAVTSETRKRREVAMATSDVATA